jgi:hypothetical protein
MEAADTLSDVRYVYGGGHLAWHRYTGSYPLSVGSYYSFRVYHCTAPGSNLVCADMWWIDQWVSIWTNEAMKCTNADGTGNCWGSNMAEVRSFDSTPHPAMGGGGMDFAVGQLALSTMWVNWTTGYATSVYEEAPYVIRWGTKYHAFGVCQTACQ